MIFAFSFWSLAKITGPEWCITNPNPQLLDVQNQRHSWSRRTFTAKLDLELIAISHSR